MSGSYEGPSMRAWRATQFGGPLEVLKLEEVERPRPGPKQALIKVSCAGVALPDLLSVQGRYGGIARPPVTPGQEVVGEIVEVGAECPFKKGQMVNGFVEFMAGC